MEICLKGRDKEVCVDMHPSVLPLLVGLALIHRSCDPRLLARLRPDVLWSICQMVSLIVGTHSARSCVKGALPSSFTPFYFIWLSFYFSLSVCVTRAWACLSEISVFLFCLEEHYAQPFRSGCLGCSNNFQKPEKPSWHRCLEKLVQVFAIVNSQHTFLSCLHLLSQKLRWHMSKFCAKRLEARNIEHVVNH